MNPLTESFVFPSSEPDKGMCICALSWSMINKFVNETVKLHWLAIISWQQTCVSITGQLGLPMVSMTQENWCFSRGVRVEKCHIRTSPLPIFWTCLLHGTLLFLCILLMFNWIKIVWESGSILYFYISFEHNWLRNGSSCLVTLVLASLMWIEEPATKHQ